ncbi:MAG: hypothetical protein EBZ48_13880, partial [Proteobacteria bacterium]|nr:hypothetical protein [Pseudomonadota bacterium]
DGDGVPNCLDACPADPKKVAAGACGCGVAESDTNQNGIPDCKAGSDLKQELSSLNAKIKGLKVFKGKKGPQPTLRAAIKTQLGSLEQFIKKRGNEIVVTKGAKPIAKTFSALQSSMKKLIVLNDKARLALYKRNTGKIIAAFIKSVT